MYSVKVEFERRDSLCHGCLSTDRRTIVLNNQIDLFFSILGVQQQNCVTKILLCWECVAFLRKIRCFQNRIQNAQFILQQSLYGMESPPVSSLSSLTITNQDFYNATIDYDSPKEKVHKQKEQKVKKLKVPKNSTNDFLMNIIKQEHADDDDTNHFNYANEDSYTDDEILTIDLEKLKQLEDTQVEIKLEKVKKRNSSEKDVKIKKQSIRRYESKARFTKLDIDLSDTKKHCSSVVLTEEEIEEVLERDKTGVGCKKLVYKCAECKKAYKRVVDLRRHETFQHIIMKSFPTKCMVCEESVTSPEALDSHWRRHNCYFKCDMCGWLSHSLASMTKHHRRVHTTQYTCLTCEAQCNTLREFSNHYKKMHERIICDHCGKSFIKKKTLETHLKRHHTPATCYECNRTYAHYHVLENHYRMQHPHLTRGDTRTELAYCVECDKQFPSVYKYRRHLATAATHTPPKPTRVPCPECGKVFARKIRMTNHFKSVHINTTKHRCDICNKTFCSAFSARTHRQHVHEKIPMPKNKMCDICGRGFSTNRILANHRRTHTGERPYKCAYCPATFAQRTAMKTHERTQHKHADS